MGGLDEYQRGSKLLPQENRTAIERKWTPEGQNFQQRIVDKIKTASKGNKAPQ